MQEDKEFADELIRIIREKYSSCSNFLGMYDEEGNLEFCKCGKPATSAIVGTESCIVMCSECFNKK